MLTFSDATALTLIVTGLFAIVLPAVVQALWLLLLTLAVVGLPRYPEPNGTVAGGNNGRRTP